MLSQQENPPGILRSHEQPMVSKEINTEADIKRFSIRQYVLACRQRSILLSWPFPEKYLQMCLNHGLRYVLPPFGLYSSVNESLTGYSNLSCSQDDKNVDFCKIEEPDLIEQPQKIKNECDLFSKKERLKLAKQDCHLSHIEGNYHNCNVSSSLSPESDAFDIPSSVYVHKGSRTLTSSKKMKDKRRRRKGRCKKRSMVDILAVAKYCTLGLEEIYRLNKFCYAETGTEGCHQTPPLENNSKIEQTDEGAYKKSEKDDHEVSNVDTVGKRMWVLKIKLNGCNSNLCNIN